MSRIKDYLYDVQEQEADRHLAKVLGIDYDDLTQLSWEIETDESKEGLIYNYRIEFSDDNPKAILEKIKRLQDGGTVYLEPWELNENYDYDEQFEAIIKNQNYLQKFKDEIGNLEELSSLKIQDEVLKSILNRQVFISIIGAMETFLSDAFINLTFSNDVYFRNFIETYPEFGKRKFELREIFSENEKLKETAKRTMLDIIYHNLPPVREMFNATFKIEFPSIKDVYQYVLIRHDLVHRNGKTKDGEEVKTDKKAIEELISKVMSFVKDIAEKLHIE